MPEAIALSDAPHAELSISLDPITAQLWRKNIPREHRQQAARAAIMAFCDVGADERKVWRDELLEMLDLIGGPGYSFACPFKRLYVTIPPWLEARRQQTQRIGSRQLYGGDWAAAFYQVALLADHCLDEVLAGYTDAEIDAHLERKADQRLVTQIEDTQR